MFTRFVAIVLIFAVSSSNLTRFMVLTSFKLNQNYIAASLCVNKDKPMMHCNGKCYLAKKLKQAEEKEKNPEQQVQKKYYEEGLLSESLGLIPPVNLLFEAGTIERPFHLSGYTSLIFQPPRA